MMYAVGIIAVLLVGYLLIELEAKYNDPTHPLLDSNAISNYNWDRFDPAHPVYTKRDTSTEGEDAGYNGGEE